MEKEWRSSLCTGKGAGAGPQCALDLSGGSPPGAPTGPCHCCRGGSRAVHVSDTLQSVAWGGGGWVFMNPRTMGLEFVVASQLILLLNHNQNPAVGGTHKHTYMHTYIYAYIYYFWGNLPNISRNYWTIIPESYPVSLTVSVKERKIFE